MIFLQLLLIPVTIMAHFRIKKNLYQKLSFNIINGHEIPLYGEGLNIRDWIHVDDHAEAILLVIQKGIIGSSYNIGVNNQVKNIDIVNSLCELATEMSLELHRKI